MRQLYPQMVKENDGIRVPRVKRAGDIKIKINGNDKKKKERKKAKRRNSLEIVMCLLRVDG